MSSKFYTVGYLRVVALCFALGATIGLATHRANADLPPRVAQPAAPSASKLLASAASASARPGSLIEYGHVSSSDNSVLDGRQFWTTFSWNSHKYRDHTVFVRPTNLNASIRYIRDIRRTVVGPRIAVWAHHRWYCNARGQSTTKANAGYWTPPSFPLSSPKTLGAATIRGEAAWQVQGGFVSRNSNSTSRLTVEVFIAKASREILHVKERGTVHSKAGMATVSGQLDYVHYGVAVKAAVPARCAS